VEIVESFFSVGDRAHGLLESREVAACWDRPSALAEYSVGGLAGHLLRATGRTEQLVGGPEPAGAEVVELAAFFGANRIREPTDLDSDFQRAVRDDGERAGGIGPEALADSFGQLLARLRAMLPGVAPDRLVPVLTIPGAATTFENYMRSRVVELIVHTDDLAVSVGVAPPEPGSRPASVAIGALVELARARSGDLGVIRGLARAERARPDDLRAL
jgi:hypothetical protein